MKASQKVKSTFLKSGYSLSSKLSRIQFQQFLNLLLKEQSFNTQVAQQLWEQASKNSAFVTVQQLCNTIVNAQNIVQNKLIDLNNQIKSAEQEISKSSGKIRIQWEEGKQALQQQKASFQQDLRLLTEPFGINMIAFIAQAKNIKKKQISPTNTIEEGEKQLKMLLILTIVFAAIEIIVIYKKYDFVNLMVLVCLLSIFCFNHFDRIYLKFTLALLIISQFLDFLWMLMTGKDYWNNPTISTNTSKQNAYLKIIVMLTFFGLLLKIPVGAIIYSYRNSKESLQYAVDVGVAKIVLSPDKKNPFSQQINKHQIFT